MSRETELQQRVDILERRLADAERDLEQFLYAISHDLRGPLRAIMSSAMILMEDYGETLDADGRSELQRQSRAAKKLSDIIDEVLKISRLGRQEMQPAEVDFSALAQRVAVEHGVQASIEPGLEAHGDEKLLKTLLAVLVDNAAKFASPGQPCRLEIGKRGQAFFVRDGGIGFPPEKAEDIFKPFEKLHPDSEYPGWGMGLSAARLVAQRHGGKIWAEGEEGNGATFYLTLGSVL